MAHSFFFTIFDALGYNIIMPSGYCNKIAIYMSQDIVQIFDDVRKYCTLAEKNQFSPVLSLKSHFLLF